MVRVAAVLFQPTGNLPKFSEGAGYSIDWACRFARMVRRHHSDAEVCIVTDYPERKFPGDIETVPLIPGGQGWDYLMQMFRPEVVRQKALLVGLDTVFIKPINEIWDREEGYIVPMDPFYGRSKGWIANAAVLVDAKHAAEVWDTWEHRDREIDKSYEMQLFGRFCEMRWMQEFTKPTAIWDEILPHRIISYKAALCQRKVMVPPRYAPPPEAKIIYFHGRPKQHELAGHGIDWFDRNWTEV